MLELGSSQPPAVELEMLQILWELGPSPVRDIHARLSEAKDTNYSTTVKMLAVIFGEGLAQTRPRCNAAHLSSGGVS